MNAGDTAFYSAMCSICIYYDTRPCIFLWRNGTKENVGNTMMQCVFIMGVSASCKYLLDMHYLSVETMQGSLEEQNGLALTELE